MDQSQENLELLRHWNKAELLKYSNRARSALARLEKGDCIAMRDQIVDTADSDARHNNMAWECWMEVFQHDPDMLRRFQEAIDKE